MDDAVWLTERVVAKAESEWKEAIPLMKQLNLKPQFMNFKAWLWASATSNLSSKDPPPLVEDIITYIARAMG